MIGFILNIPYTVVGFLVAVVSVPTQLELRTNPYVFVFNVRKFWWMVGGLKNIRAITIGHVVILGPKLEEGDLEHELIHVEQNQKRPLVQPVLYFIELLRKGYKNNRYEEEAYRRAGNMFKDR
ncbi:MAG TPA: hypothetical protein VJB70_04260 [Candidatus Paceibacterota bacterium]